MRNNDRIMPVVSTVAGASLETEWKKCMKHDETSYNISYSHDSKQKWVHTDIVANIPSSMCGGVNTNNHGPTKPSSRTSVEEKHVSKEEPSSAVRRAPFRSLNGRAYAVPLSMLKEFDAIYQHVQKAQHPPRRDDPLFSPLSSPGVLWRHDPYSAKVLNATFSSSGSHLSSTEEDEECGTSKRVVEGIVTRSIGVVNAAQIQRLPIRPPPIPSWIPQNLRTSNSAVLTMPVEITPRAIQPSARPVPPPSGCCFVVHSITPTRQPPARSECQSALEVAEMEDSLNACGDFVLQLCRKRPLRRLSEDCKRDEFPTLLPSFRALPPLFQDLTVHMSRRPPPLGKRSRNVSDENQSRPEGVRYVYLVDHRCRRSVCAAGVLYKLSEMVVLEGDMGIDMGTVHAVLPVEEFDQLHGDELISRGFPAAEWHVVASALILRSATTAEIHHYDGALYSFSKDLLSFLRNRLVPARFSDCRVENMEFLGCEFQADCKKVYVYYRARRRVLFRELAQYLHSFYRCRIWLHEVGRDSPNSSGATTPDLSN